MGYGSNAGVPSSVVSGVGGQSYSSFLASSVAAELQYLSVYVYVNIYMCIYIYIYLFIPKGSNVVPFWAVYHNP